MSRALKLTWSRTDEVPMVRFVKVGLPSATVLVLLGLLVFVGYSTFRQYREKKDHDRVDALAAVQRFADCLGQSRDPDDCRRALMTENAQNVTSAPQFRDLAHQTRQLGRRISYQLNEDSFLNVSHLSFQTIQFDLNVIYENDAKVVERYHLYRETNGPVLINGFWIESKEISQAE